MSNTTTDNNVDNGTDNKDLLEWTKKKRKRSNENMNINNYYRYNPPNFKLLANKYPSFDKFIINKTEKIFNIDWKDSNATKELTRVLLDHDFGLKIELPDNYLCPTLTLRINYLYWISDQLKKLNIINTTSTTTGTIKGIDIGTGTSCIFPLLGVKLFNDWSFTALDINDKVLEYAKNNIDINKLGDRITLFKNENGDILLNLIPTTTTPNDKEQEEQQQFDFCLCNPPFFSELSETGLNNKSVCTGSKDELVTEGGELEFISKIIKESFQLGSKVKLYSTMVGRKVNLNKVLNLLLKQYHCPKSNISTSELAQGNTTRWVISWYFYNSNNNNNNSNTATTTTTTTNNNNSTFLTRLERRKLYREGISLTFNPQLQPEITRVLLDLNSNIDIGETRNDSASEYSCICSLNQVLPVEKKQEKEIQFSFMIQVDDQGTINIIPLEDTGENREIINSNLYFILKFLENIKDKITMEVTL